MASNGAYDQREALLAATSTLKVPEPGTINRNLLPDAGIRVIAASTLVEDVVKAIRDELPQPCIGFWQEHYPSGFKCSDCGRLLDVSELSSAERRTILIVLNGSDHYRWP